MSSSFDQARFQVRFEWGAAGLDRLAAADIVVVVDVLGYSGTVIDRIDAGERVVLDAASNADALTGAAVAMHAADAAPQEPAPKVLLGALRNASAVAAAVLSEQQRRGARTSVAVIACGALSSGDERAPRFAVEDLLGAGAVIDALGALGVDHTSPEAAAACEAFRGLRGATRHLLTASGSGQELALRGRGDEVVVAGIVDASASVPVLCDGSFTAL